MNLKKIVQRCTQFCVVFVLLMLHFNGYSQFGNNPLRARLGIQTSAEGLIYYGDGSPGYTPVNESNAYHYYDTTGNTFLVWDRINSEWDTIGASSGGGAADGVLDTVYLSNDTLVFERTNGLPVLRTDLSGLSGAADGVALSGAVDFADEEINIIVSSPGNNFSIDLTNLGNLNTFSGWDKDASDDFDGAYSSLTGIPDLWEYSDTVSILATQSFVNSQGFLTSFTESNDLSSSVTWATVPDGFISSSSVTQHEGDITITESQISDLAHTVEVDPIYILDSSLLLRKVQLTDSLNSLAASRVIVTPTGNLNSSDVQSALEEHQSDIDALSAGSADGVATAGSYDGANEEIDITVAAPGNNFSIDVSDLATKAQVSDSIASNSFTDTYVTGATFATGTGVLTLSGTAGSDVTVNLDGRYLESFTESNDLSSSVTWANVPDAFITQTSVTQHEAALTITESQISDLAHFTGADITGNESAFSGWDKDASDDFDGAYSSLTGVPDLWEHSDTGATLATQAFVTGQGYLTTFTEANDLTGAVTWATVPDGFISQSSVTQYESFLTITESQISDLSHTVARTDEEITDLAGGMFSGNTETLITATFQDADNTIDLEVENDLSQYDNSVSKFWTHSDTASTLSTQYYVDNNSPAFFQSVAASSGAATIDCDNQGYKVFEIDFGSETSVSLTINNPVQGGQYIVYTVNAESTNTLDFPAGTVAFTGQASNTSETLDDDEGFLLVYDGTKFIVK